VPSGKTYNFYGQKIDLDLKVKNPITGKWETNRKRMQKGNNPYVLCISVGVLPRFLLLVLAKLPSP
jgi:hypothetical protein